MLSYTVQKFNPNRSKVHHSEIPNEVDRKFNNRELYKVIVSDLTYLSVGNKWNDVCTIVNLHNQEILASASGPQKC